MEENTINLFKELITCISKHLLNHVKNESQALKIIKLGVEQALEEEKYHG